MPVGRASSRASSLPQVPHIAGVTALYTDSAVTRQMKLVELNQDHVIRYLGLEQYSRIRRAHCGSLGMGAAALSLRLCGRHPGAMDYASPSRGAWWLLRTRFS